jgi:hypothetical protein
VEACCVEVLAVARKSRLAGGQHLTALAAIMGLLLGIVAKGEAASYTLTSIPDSSGPFNLFGTPFFNDSGFVAVKIFLDAGRSATVGSDGTAITTIASISNFASVGNPCINDGGSIIQCLPTKDHLGDGGPREGVADGDYLVCTRVRPGEEDAAARIEAGREGDHTLGIDRREPELGERLFEFLGPDLALTPT